MSSQNLFMMQADSCSTTLKLSKMRQCRYIHQQSYSAVRKAWCDPTSLASPCLQTIEAKRPVVVDSRDVNLLILNKYTNFVEVWDMALGKRIHVFKNTGVINDAVFSNDSSYVLAVTSSQLIFWDITSGEMVRDIKIRGPHISGRVHNTAWQRRISNDGKFLVTYMDGEPIEIRNVIEATKFQLPSQSFRFIRDIKWSNDSKLLYVATIRLHSSRIWLEGHPD